MLIIILAALVTAMPILVVGAYRHAYPRHGQVLSVVSGLDTQGRAWTSERVDAVTLCLRQNGRVYVGACGTRTRDDVTRRLGIVWES